MKSKPMIFNLLALFYLLVAVSLPVQVYFLNEGHFDAMELTWLNQVVVAGCLVSAWKIFFVDRKVVYFVLGCSGLIFINNLSVGVFALDFSLVQTMSAFGFWLVAHAPLASRTLWPLLRSNQNHWWKTPERSQVAYPVVVRGLTETEFDAVTFDISETGMFVKVKESQLVLRQKEFAVDAIVNLHLRLDALTQLRCRGRVARQGSASGVAGLGIQFLEVDKVSLNQLKRGLALAA